MYADYSTNAIRYFVLNLRPKLIVEQSLWFVEARGLQVVGALGAPVYGRLVQYGPLASLKGSELWAPVLKVASNALIIGNQN